MKVLLFVQTGDSRPKCAHQNVAEWLWRRSGEEVRGLFYDKVRGTVRLAWIYGAWVKALRAADRWWLVECENADEGRDSILCATGQCTHDDTFYCAQGRILASGGKQEVKP